MTIAWESTRQRWQTLLLAALVLASSLRAEAAPDPLVYAVVVGNNEGLGSLPQLHYADDDALRFYRLATRLAPEANVALLTELDVDTWRRIQLGGARPPAYLPPTRKQLLQVISYYKQQIEKARREQPDQPVHFYFFYSGHGEKGYFILKQEGRQLADAAFTGEDLERTFADSRATMNSLFIDACKSQSLFISKGGDQEDDELGPDFGSLIERLDRTAGAAPIGVITSTVSDQPAGEARDIQGGYFSHVLTSGLSGAADANSDGLIHYGELAAFVSFHTRRISGQVPWFRPPQGKLSSVLVRLQERQDLLELLPGFGGHFAVFDARGNNLLLEVHKTAAQWTRLILAPDSYQVVWMQGEGRGQAALADLRQGRQQLTRSSFTRQVALGQDAVAKGEGLGAPPDPDAARDIALTRFDPGTSGFDQPFTPRVVSALTAAYNAGRSATTVNRRPTGGRPPATASARHLLSLGYGYLPPPVEPAGFGQGISLAYSYRFALPLRLGARAIFGFSDHTAVGEGRSFRMQRLILQAEGGFAYPVGDRLELAAGGYLGWQLVMLTRDTLIMDIDPGELDRQERPGTVLSGDPAGFRAGLLGSLRVRLVAQLWLSAGVGGGLELVHQQQAETGESSAAILWRPQATLEVGYAF